MSGNQGETKSGSVAPAVVIPQLNQAQSRALARGRTIGHYGRRVQPNLPTLRQRAAYDDEGFRWNDGGGALFTARTEGVLRGIRETGQHRAEAAPVIRAIGRQNVEGRFAGMGRMSAATQNPRTSSGLPTFITRHVTGLAGEKTPISDLTKTSLGASSKRKGKTRKDPRARGGRRRKRRKSRRRKSRRRKSRQHGGLMTRGGKTSPTPKLTHSNTTQFVHKSHRKSLASALSIVGGKRKKKKFRKGSKSKTHRGKDFETRKTSKNYNSKRWKRMTGRRTIRAPLFPFV